MFAEGATSPTKRLKAAEHTLLQTTRDQNTSCAMCHDCGPRSWDAKPFYPTFFNNREGHDLKF